jgi:hypothetical protein
MSFKAYTAKWLLGPAADLPTFSTNDPDYRPYVYQETDTGILRWWNGSDWLVLNPTAGNLNIGMIDLPLTSWHVITTNDIGDLAVASGNGGKLAGNTTPILERLNGATDKKLHLLWAATVTAEVQQEFIYPPDLDPAEDITVHLLVVKDTNLNDEATIGVGFFEGIGDTDAGDDTEFITEIVAAEKTVTILAADVGVYPNAAAVTLIPSAHADDAVALLASWITYTRKPV